MSLSILTRVFCSMCLSSACSCMVRWTKTATMAIKNRLAISGSSVSLVRNLLSRKSRAIMISAQASKMIRFDLPGGRGLNRSLKNSSQRARSMSSHDYWQSCARSAIFAVNLPASIGAPAFSANCAHCCASTRWINSKALFPCGLNIIVTPSGLGNRLAASWRLPEWDTQYGVGLPRRFGSEHRFKAFGQELSVFFVFGDGER